MTTSTETVWRLLCWPRHLENGQTSETGVKWNEKRNERKEKNEMKRDWN